AGLARRGMPDRGWLRIASEVHPACYRRLLHLVTDPAEGGGIDQSGRVANDGVVDVCRGHDGEVGLGGCQGLFEDRGVQHPSGMDQCLAAEAVGMLEYRPDVQGDSELNAYRVGGTTVVPFELECEKG